MPWVHCLRGTTAGNGLSGWGLRSRWLFLCCALSISTETVEPWKVQTSLTLTIIAFFDTLKYPPSLDYLLMTLGPALIVLACLDGVTAERGLGRILLVFGRVPLFYYVLHIFLIHAMAI